MTKQNETVTPSGTHSKAFKIFETLPDPLPLFPAFPLHTCPGDFRDVQHGPFTIRATIHYDGHTRPDDYECYSPEIIAAWRRDEWRYVGVVLSVHLDDLELDARAASLWGVDCNFPGGDNLYLSECADDLLPEALERAEQLRAQLVAKLK